jgi:hypothetical protein
MKYGPNLERKTILSYFRQDRMSKKTISGYCPFKDGLMYKPGATFYDPILEKTLVCCSGIKNAHAFHRALQD